LRAQQESHQYWPALDGLRALAFTLVLVHHTSPPDPMIRHSLEGILIRLGSWGWTGVDLFFVLSGFLISYLLLQEQGTFGTISIKNFYARRILRIWPVYFTLLAGCAIVPLLYHAPSKLYDPYLRNILVPYALFFGNFIVGSCGTSITDMCNAIGFNWVFLVTLLVPLWSLCVEEQFYMVWPWVLKAIGAKRMIWSAAAGLICLSLAARLAVYFNAVHTHQGSELYRYNTLCHIDALMFGAVLAVAEYRYPGWAKPLVRGWRGAVVLLAVLSVWAVAVMFVPGFFARDISIVPFTTLFAAAYAALLLLALNWEPCRKFFSNAVLTSIGKVTYTMYIIHFFMIAWFGNFIPNVPDPRLNWFLHAATTFVATLCVAKVSWFVLESRMLALRKYFNRRVARSDSAAHAQPELVASSR